MLSSKAKGVVCMVASAFGFALMAFFVRLCDDYGGAVSSFQKSFFRNFIACALALAVFLRTRKAAGGKADPRSPRNARRFSTLAMLVLRSVLGTIGIFANFYALGRIPIAEGQTLNKTAPFFTVVFAYLFLRERVNVRQLLTLLIAFGGVILIAKPGFAGAAGFPLAIGLLSGVCAGGAYTCVRFLRNRAVDPAEIILFFSAFSCAASLPFICAHYDPMTPAQLFIMLGAGFGAAIGQFGITLAYGYAAPREIAVFDYTSILFAAVFGYVAFGQMVDIYSFIGFLAIIFAAFRLRHV